MTARFPRLIYGEINAFGHKGPLKMMPGYEILSQAFGGVISITGEPDRAPVRCGPSICDFGSGMWLAIGLLAALHERHVTGKGGIVQTSLFETALSWTTVSASSFLCHGQAPGADGVQPSPDLALRTLRNRYPPLDARLRQRQPVSKTCACSWSP